MKTKAAFLALVISFGVLIVSAPLSAHHGNATFENGKVLTLKGTVVDWLWSNPHCLLQFDVKGDDGQVAHWIGETQNPVTMINGGWSKSSFKPGDQVTVTLVPVKNNKPMGSIRKVVLPNGNVLDAQAGIANGYKPDSPSDK